MHFPHRSPGSFAWLQFWTSGAGHRWFLLLLYIRVYPDDLLHGECCAGPASVCRSLNCRLSCDSCRVSVIAIGGVHVRRPLPCWREVLSDAVASGCFPWSWRWGTSHLGDDAGGLGAEKVEHGPETGESGESDEIRRRRSRVEALNRGGRTSDRLLRRNRSGVLEQVQCPSTVAGHPGVVDGAWIW